MSEARTYDPAEGIDGEAPIDPALISADAPGADGDDPDAITDEDHARAMGWKDRHEFRGPRDLWTDYPEFLAAPENNPKIMREQLHTLTDRVARQDRDNQALRKSVQDAMALARNASDAGYQRALRELKDKQREAVTEADAEAYDAVTAQIDAMEANRPKEVAEPPPADTSASPAGRDPAYVAFENANPWIGKEAVLTPQLVAIHNAILTEAPTMPLADQLALALKRLKAANPDHFPFERQTPMAANPRRSAAVSTPSGGQGANRRPGKSGFDTIEDAEDREEARRAFESIKRADPSVTETEYLFLYNNPKGDLLGFRAEQRAAAARR